MAVPFADIAFKNNPKRSQRQPAEVRIVEREYAHDVAVITLDYEWAGQSKYNQGSPVTISWGFLPSEIGNFYGYVNHTEQVHHDDKPNQLKVFCIGASLPCNQAHQRSFRKISAGGIISRIAREHKLSVFADPSSRYHDHIPQLGQSDWNLMVRVAKDIGFTLGCRQTTIQFRRRVIDTRPGRQPVFRLTPGVYNQRGAVYKFSHKAGSAPLADRRIIQVDGMDDQGNIVSSVDTGDCCDPVKAVFTKFVPDAEPIRSIHDGQTLLSGLSGMNRFYVIANAELSGDSRVRPGQTIAVQGIDSDSDGFWWTGAVTHIITPTDYRMVTELGRETIFQTTYVPAPVSDAGKPQILDEPGVDNTAEPMPDSEYSPLDDCIPVENLVTDGFGEVTSLVDDPFASEARAKMKRQRPRPTRQRGCCVPDPAAPVVTPPRLHGWQAVTSRTRVTS